MQEHHLGGFGEAGSDDTDEVETACKLRTGVVGPVPVNRTVAGKLACMKGANYLACYVVDPNRS